MRISFFIIILTLLVSSCTSAGAGNRGDTSGNRIDCDSTEQTNCDLPLDPFYNNEKADVAKINSALRKVSDISDKNERVIAATQEFIGTPYVGGTLNLPEKEQLYVNTDGLDCLTFVETVIALSAAADSGQPTLDDFLRKLRSIRYRDGKIEGYPSRLHYISEWSTDNSRRGNFSEITEKCDHAVKKVKTIDYMTKNRQLYPALKDEEVFNAIRDNEAPLKDLHYSIIPTESVDKAAKSFLKSGDIVAIVTERPGLDVSHVGVVNIKNGVPYLIHASSKYKKVVNDTLPLRDYLKQQKSPGIRVFRLH